MTTAPALPDRMQLVAEAAVRMQALGVPIADLCAWNGPTCERPRPFGPESPTSSHGLCDACRAQAFPRYAKLTKG